MKIPVVKINQNGNVFYVGRILVSQLVKIATSKIRKSYSALEAKGYLEEVDQTIKNEIKKGNIWYLKDVLLDPNIQRKKSEKRLKEIGEYLSSANSIFPNSIIVNLASKIDGKGILELAKISDTEIEFDDDKVVATVIDGQHRLGGFEYCKDKNLINNFEVVVTIMLGLEVSQQAELFGIINGKQTAVSKSILYDLSEISEKEYTEIVTAHLISKWFNINEQSPLFGKIKMLGYGEGVVSQAAFIDALLPLIEKQDRLNNETAIIPVLRESYLKKDDKDIIKKLYDYFKAFKENFPIAWNYEFNRDDTVKYVLTKSTGISGLLFAYPIFYCYCFSKKDFSYGLISKLVSKLKIKEFDFSSKKYSGGGIQLQRGLSADIINVAFEGIDVAALRTAYIDYYRTIDSD